MKPRAILLAFATSLIFPAAFAQTAPTTPGVVSAAANARPDCTLGDRSTACASNTAVFSAPSVQNGRVGRVLIYNDLKTYGPSINFGNSTTLPTSSSEPAALTSTTPPPPTKMAPAI